MTLSYTNNNKVVINEWRHRKTVHSAILQRSWNFWDLCVRHKTKFLMEVSIKKYFEITQTKEQWAKAELPWRVEIYSTFNRHGRMRQSYESEYWHNAPLLNINDTKPDKKHTTHSPSPPHKLKFLYEKHAADQTNKRLATLLKWCHIQRSVWNIFSCC